MGKAINRAEKSKKADVVTLSAHEIRPDIYVSV